MLTSLALDMYAMIFCLNLCMKNVILCFDRSWSNLGPGGVSSMVKTTGKPMNINYSACGILYEEIKSAYSLNMQVAVCI